MLFSEPKIPQSTPRAGCQAENSPFSALQRAENSSIQAENSREIRRNRFQCSSASRKFLNYRKQREPTPPPLLSVLFSEPKIPQSKEEQNEDLPSLDLSVLFSEPKIPQL